MENYLKKELYSLIQKDTSFFDFIVEGSLDGLWYWDLENPEQEWMSPSFWTVLGYDPTTKEHLASAWQDIINQDDLKLALVNFNKHLNDPKFPYDQEVRYKHSNGSTVWIRCRGLAIRNEQGEAIRMLGAHQNITSLKENEIQLQKEKEAVKKSNEKYLALYNQSPFALQSLDKNGKILEVNNKWLQILGYTKNEVLNTSFKKFVHPDSLENFEVNFKKFLNEGLQKNIEYKLLKKNGDYIIALFEGCTKIEGPHSSTFCSFKDVRKEKEIQLEISEKNKILKINEERYKLISNISTDYSYSHKITKTGKIILEWSFGAFEEILGYKPEEFTSLEIITSKIHPDDIATYQKRMQRVLQGETVTVEIRVKSKDGKIKWIKNKAIPGWDSQKKKVIRIIGVAQDITIQKETELKLLESEARFKLISNISSDYYYSYKVENNEITTLEWCLGAFEQITGYQPKDIYTKNDVIKILHPDDLELIKERNNNLKKGKTVVSEFRIITKTGAIIWVKDKGVPQWDNKHKNLTNIIFTAVDITKHKEAELALLESEQKFRGIFENSVVGIVLSDAEGNIKDINQEFCFLGGYSYEELTNLNLHEITHPDDFGKVFAQLQLLKDGIKDSYRLEKRMICKNGSFKWINVLVTAKRNSLNEIEGFQIMVFDISERIEMDNRLKESEQKFRGIFEGASIGIALSDLERNPIDVNEELLRISGYSYEELLNLNFIDITHPDDIAKELQQRQLLKERKKDSYRINKRMKCKDGTYKWVDTLVTTKRNSLGELNGYLVMAIDIHERIEMDNRLKQKDEHLSLAIEGANIGTWDWDIKTNDVYTSPLWMKKLGYDSNEVIHDMDWWIQNSHPDDFEKCKKLMKSHIIGSSDVYNAELRVKNKDGNYFWIQDKAKVIDRDIDGNPLRISGIHIDISDLKKTEKELIIAKEKAEESNQLKSEFLHNMSHEIRTPMNGIIGFSELLSGVENNPEKQHYYTTIIQNSSKQLLRIIDDILEISRLDTKQIKLNKEEFSLNNFILELFSVFDLKSKERNIPIYVKNSLSDQESIIQTDKIKLHKIISNLLENALKFTNKGFIELGYFIKENTLILYVKDTGIGIEQKNKDKIFERFSQETNDVASTHGGLGLGLSISKENAQLLGGTISFESKKGKGATFYVNLPYHPAHLNQNNTNPTTTQPKQYNILIAEDEEVNYLYFESVISRFDLLKINLIHAKNGQEAVDICTQNKDIDLIFMDIKMPVLNGYKATELIKKMHPTLPIVAQTAYSTLADEELAFSHGCDAYLSKPIQSKKIIEVMYRFLNIVT
ncbi:PAS domain S-box protein [Lutibacter holmesii]|uniref:histidine kinase n=1 Tax=Lutibacter holmesii TaxID=1137985 RepID=A0ABW3WQW9_9FLAO